MWYDWSKLNRMVRITHEPTGVTTVARLQEPMP